MKGTIHPFLVLLALCFKARCAQSCIKAFSEIYELESQVPDVNVPRTYHICPKRIYEIGALDFNYDLITTPGIDYQPPLPVRPNMSIKCGDTGSRDDLCWIAGGDIQIDATSYRGIPGTVENVSIEGFVFIGARKYSLWGSKPGDITFRDCEWKDHVKSVVPILLDYFDGSSKELFVTFTDSVFHDNRYLGWGSHTSLIYGNSAQNRIAIKNTVFESNDMINNNTLSATNSFIIETLGPLTIESSCFENNRVGVSNAVVFGNQFSSSENYNSNSTGTLCDFAASFQNLQQFDDFSPFCVGALERTCLATGTRFPTTAPTPKPPTIAPTLAPSFRPSHSPAPSETPTRKRDFVFTPPAPDSAAPSRYICGSLVMFAVLGFLCFL